MLSVSASIDSRWLISGSKDRCVHFWDTQTTSLQFVLQGHKNSGQFFFLQFVNPSMFLTKAEKNK